MAKAQKCLWKPAPESQESNPQYFSLFLNVWFTLHVKIHVHIILSCILWSCKRHFSYHSFTISLL